MPVFADSERCSVFLLREASLICPDEFVMYTNCPFGCTIQIPQRSSDNNVNYFLSKFFMASKLEIFVSVFWKPFKHFFIFVDSMKPPTFAGSFHFKVRHVTNFKHVARCKKMSCAITISRCKGPSEMKKISLLRQMENSSTCFDSTKSSHYH